MNGVRLACAIVTWVVLVVGWLVVVPVVRAADSRDRAIDQFYHTAWTVREGAPGQVTALAQTSDGYLWLGTQTGLYRFDGVRFERFRPREGGDFLASSVASLYAPPSGGLWVGFRYGVASFVTGDRATHYAASSGLPTATIYAIGGTPDGHIWAATFNGLARLDGQRWSLVGASMGLPGNRARNLSVDREGRLWVATDQALAWLPPGGKRFELATRAVGRVNRIAEAPDGTIWVAEADGGVRPAWAGDAPAEDRGPSLNLSSAGLLFDRDGALWMPTLGDGIRRVPRVRDLPRQRIEASGTAAQQFVERDGLSSDYLSAVIQDREGNIWVGGSRGLDRFRISRLLPAPLSPGATDFALVAAQGHGVWVGTKNRPLTHADATQVEPGDFPEAITAASRDREGTWLGGPHGVWRLHDGKPERFAPLPAEDYTGVQAIVGDGKGGAWLSINRPGIYHYTAGAWVYDAMRAIANDPAPLILMNDMRGRLWMGFARNTIVIRDRGKDTVLGPASGLAVGNVTALLEDRGAVWLGGELGIGVVVGEHARMLATLGEPLRGVSGLVRDARGDFWANTAQGVARIDGAHMARALQDPSYRPPVKLFDSLDGLPGTPAQFRPLPTALVADDGRLWFATTSGVVSIDPADVPRNPLPPPVSIRSITTDAGSWPVTATVNLPAHTERLRIGYTATSLSMPERVRFRYRMEGIDTRWRDAGTEREAVYTDPPPGSYVFRVTAANEDDVWNENGTSIAIVVAPTFFQTPWFVVICMVVAFAALWLAFYLRMRRMEAQLRARLHERHAERERIARELHDTLLQSIQGLTMRFQAIANRVPADQPLRIAMEGALDRAEEALVEARDRVRDLRGHAGETAALDVALADLSRAYAMDHTVPVLVETDIDMRDMDILARDELYGIAREAVHNAIAHAEASRIEVTITADAGELVMRVRDDGRGIDDAVLRSGGRAGHWGLRGIQERARTIGGSAAFASRADGGTEVIVRTPMNRVFPSRARWWRRGWRERG
ncbi:MAG TPA: two-component regulator propeller domain-containing protein [Luteibacter sp.]|uniref:sensor histidine kinase n=1 Tax=Luteibacter sp. TaxID=1886636 RepID=UPI002BF3234B|nr:two-component regulator propeller domain-containing protein [Luteibacter sp.]HVI53890.1 two-component regulator propeller domain-containing protein [Luteibacter sp.]